MTFTDIRTYARRPAGLVTSLSERLEATRERRDRLDERIDAMRELLTIAARAALERGGEISARELMLDLADADREHVMQLMHTAGIEP